MDIQRRVSAAKEDTLTLHGEEITLSHKTESKKVNQLAVPDLRENGSLSDPEIEKKVRSSYIQTVLSHINLMINYLKLFGAVADDYLVTRETLIGLYRKATRKPDVHYPKLTDDFMQMISESTDTLSNLVEQVFRIKINNYCQILMLEQYCNCLLYTSPSPRDLSTSRMPSSA